MSRAAAKRIHRDVTDTSTVLSLVSPTAIYVRISEDRKQQEKGVTDQVSDGTTLVGLHPELALIPDGVFADNDLSALDGGPRPQFDRLMGLVQRGHVKVIVVWQMSRFWRNRRERAATMEVLQRYGVRIVSIKGPDIDFSTAQGRMLAGIIGEVDTAESEIKAERVARAAKRRADAGQPHGGRRAYGYTAKARDDAGNYVGRHVVQEEADVLRDAAGRILDGTSLNSVVRKLQTDGVPAPFAARWEAQTLKDMLLSPTVAGRRVHQGRDVGRADWEPILDEKVWYALQAKLRPQAAKARGEAFPNQAKYLLSFIAVCGKDGCGAGVYGQVAQPGKAPGYVCPPTVRGGCGGVRRNMEHVDRTVTEVLLRRLADPAVRRGLLSTKATSVDDVVRVDRELGNVRAGLLTVARTFAERLAADPTDDIAAAQFREADGSLRAKLDELLREQAGQARGSALEGLVDVEDLVAHWPAVPLHKKREIVRATLTITILPTGRNPHFDPATVRIEPLGA